MMEVEPNIMYAFLGFLSLMLLTMMGILYRQSRDVGGIRGDIRALHDRLDATNVRIDESRADLGRQIADSHSHLASRIDATNTRIDEARADLGRQIADARTDLLGRLDATNAKIGDARTDLLGRLGDTNANLGGRIDTTNARIDETRTDLGRQIVEIRADLKYRLDDIRTDLVSRLDDTRAALVSRVESLETIAAPLHREVGEVKGMQYSLYDRLELMVRHRHDHSTGAAILTPGEMAAD